ncbi:polyketide synthase [Aspergillus terreus]|uniref:Polyketide synthase n=1 Tax=Aspergillus terreus TaxID=33178 RepID=A0A5M3ZAZ1_ASPTE|nr:hypothetical protein ATETN484_0011010300 [Aspergillus terreus]GFF18740.1 polyketide synthase [Aspergillus terreus]
MDYFTVLQQCNSDDYGCPYKAEGHPSNCRFEHSKIAIVGYSGRFPSAASNEAFWELLRAGRDVHREIPRDRFDWETYYDPTGKRRNTSRVKYGCWIDEPGLFDTKFFNMSPKEAENTDPAQRLAITTTYEAMEMAGMVRNRTPSTQQDRVGVFFGTTSDDWREVNSGQDVGTYFIPGGNCNAFDDEASGYCRSDAVGSVILKRLEDAEADNDPIFAFIVGTNTNHCGQTDSITRPHEGDQVSVFKRIVRYSGIDPLDISYVEMHGTGTQAGDATEMNSVLSVFVPEYKRMQMTPARPLYLGSAKANIGHAESASGVSSLIKVMLMMKHSEIPPHCGIKSRINHNYPLDLEQRGVRIPVDVTPWKRDALPSGKRSVFLNNFSAAGGNTAMLVEDAPIRRCTVDNADARSFHPIAVSAKSPKSLVGNINALIAFIDQKRGSTPVGPLSYTTTARRMHHNYRAMVTGTDLSSILAELKSLASDTEALLADMKPIPAGAKKQTRVIFMFSGQGVMYSDLAKSLFTVNPAFQSAVFELNRLSRLLGFPSFVEIIDGTTTAAALPSVSAVVSHLALVCVQIALFELWKTWGVTPAAVIGHSLGEYPALYAAGVLSAADVIYLVGTRATLLERLCTSGTHSMLAIKASWQTVERLMVEHSTAGSCELACINQLSGHVIAGLRDSITELSRQAQQMGIETVHLAVPFAFHSAQVEPILAEFEASACHVTFHPPTIPFLSPLLGRAIPVGDIGTLTSKYVSAACRGTVNFVKAVGVAADVVNIQHSIWLEIGAHPLCSGMVKGTLGPQIRTIATLRQNVEPYKTIVSGLETLYLAGVEINWNEYHRHFPSSQSVIELPLYSWDLKNYWIQYRNDFLLTKGEKPLQVAPPSPPLRKHISPTAQCVVEESHGTEKSSMVVESDIFDEKLLHILQGHLVNGAALAPSSMYADLALTVAVYLISQSPDKLPVDTTGLDVANVRVDNPLIARSNQTSHLFRMSAAADWSSKVISMRIFSVDSNGKRTTSHARLEVRVVPGQRWLAEWKRNTHLITARIDALAAAVHDPNSDTHLVKRGMAYKLFAAIVHYKKEYQGMSEIILDSHRLEAVSTVEFQVGKEEFYLNPRWIDSLGGIAGFIMNANDGVDSHDQVFINHGWERMRIAEPLQQDRTYRAYNRMQLVENTTYAGDTYILYDGRIVAIFEGVTFQGVPRRVLDHLLPSSGARKAGSIKQQRTPVPMAPTSRMAPAQRDVRPVPKSSSHSPSSSGVFGRILALISEEVGIPPSELKPDTEFAALGIDSLLTLTITAKIREELGLDFPSSLFVDQSTVGELQVLVGGGSNEGEISATVSSGSSSDDIQDSQVTSSATSVYPDTPLTEGPSCPDRTRASMVLRQIISEETQVPIDELKPSTGLTDIGVDSLLGLTVSGKVQELLGADIAGNIIMSFDTIQDLEDEICSELGFAKRETITPWSGDRAVSRSTGPSPASVARTCSDVAPLPQATSILLSGSPQTARVVFFLFPDGSGSASSYAALAPAIDPDVVAVYGLNCPWRKTATEMTRLGITMATMVAQYVPEIQRLLQLCHSRGNNPSIALGGWSAGGILAVEAIRQIHAQGLSRISHLVLLDSPNPIGLQNPPKRMYDFFDSLGIFGGSPATPDSKVKPRTPEWLLQHFDAFIRVLDAYEPTPLDNAPASLIMYARDGVCKDSNGPKMEIRPDDPREMLWLINNRTDFSADGWTSILGRQQLRVEVLDEVNHFTLMDRGPAMEKMGSILAKFLNHK